jgi:hypothetical protein
MSEVNLIKFSFDSQLWCMYLVYVDLNILSDCACACACACL